MDTNVSIVNDVLEIFVGISDRLKEERLRLGLSQSDFADVGGAHRKSQGNYESGERSPDAQYLSAIAEAGADVQYIVTGQRQGRGIGEAAVHQAVLDAVDLLSLGKKVDAQQLAKAVVKLIARPTSPPPAGPANVAGDHVSITVSNNQGQVAQRMKVKNGKVDD